MLFFCHTLWLVGWLAYLVFWLVGILGVLVGVLGLFVGLLGVLVGFLGILVGVFGFYLVYLVFLFGVFGVWQRFRSTLQMSCKASPQIWRFTWCRKSNFNLIFWIVRCSAFRIFITLWVKNGRFGRERAFSLKKCQKKSVLGGKIFGSPDFREV